MATIIQQREAARMCRVVRRYGWAMTPAQRSEVVEWMRSTGLDFTPCRNDRGHRSSFKTLRPAFWVWGGNHGPLACVPVVAGVVEARIATAS